MTLQHAVFSYTDSLSTTPSSRNITGIIVHTIHAAIATTDVTMAITHAAIVITQISQKLRPHH